MADYEAIPEDEQVPDAINDPDHWNTARALIAEIEEEAR